MAQTITFNVNSAARRRALALIYDLEGFSQFANQPDVDLAVARYLNRVSSAMATVIYGGMPYWIPQETRQEWREFRPPVHEKYLGDGALYIWTFTPDDPQLIGATLELCNRLRQLTRYFSVLEHEAYDAMPFAVRLRGIRFGLAVGDVHELERADAPQQREYVGRCINLASRLQSYCPKITFAASATTVPSGAALTSQGYVRVIATDIKGFGPQVVILDAQQYQSLDAKTRSEHFDEEH